MLAHSIANAATVEKLPILTETSLDEWRVVQRRVDLHDGPSVDLPAVSAASARVSAQLVSNSVPRATIDVPVGRIDLAIHGIGSVESLRRRTGVCRVWLTLRGSPDELLPLMALFPEIADYEIEPITQAVVEDAVGLPESARGFGSVPTRATQLLDSWLSAKGLSIRAFAVIALGKDVPSRVQRRNAAIARKWGLAVVTWEGLEGTWPIEMLAALLSKAALRIVSNPAAAALASALDLRCVPSVDTWDVTADGSVRWTKAKDLAHCAAEMREATPLLAFCAQAVGLAPNLPEVRERLAEVVSRLEPQTLGERGAFRLFRRSSIPFALEHILAEGGRAASVAEPFISGLILAHPALRQALETAVDRDRFEAAISNRALHLGSAARLLSTLLCRVMIREPVLLDLLDRVSCTFVDRVLRDPTYVPRPKVAAFFDRLAQQIWIHDGMLMSIPDPERIARLDSSERSDDAIVLARRLVPSLSEVW